MYLRIQAFKTQSKLFLAQQDSTWDYRAPRAEHINRTLMFSICLLSLVRLRPQRDKVPRYHLKSDERNTLSRLEERDTNDGS